MQEREVAIFSDCLSALSALRSLRQNHHIVKKIYHQLMKMTSKGIRTTFIWIPGHKDIGYNNIADKLAKEAASSATNIQIPVLTTSETKSIILQLCTNLWNNNYVASETVKEYKRIFSSVHEDPAYTDLSKRYSTILLRLQSGHCRLYSHLHRIGLHETGQCDACSVDETVEHFILICPKYRDHRKTLELAIRNNKISRELPSILTNPHTILTVIEFVIASGRQV